MKLTFEQININRANAGLPPLKKKVPPKKELTVRELKEKRERLAALKREREENKRINANLKATSSAIKRDQRSISYLQKKKQFAETIFEHLCNPDNPPVKNRLKEYMALVGYSKYGYPAFNKMFPRDELIEIENAALDQRRKQYANRLAMVDDGLFGKAATGNAPEAKLVYQRFEKWSDKNTDDSDARPLVVIQIRGQVEKIIPTETIDVSPQKLLNG
jgi:hypothetical protein